MQTHAIAQAISHAAVAASRPGWHLQRPAVVCSAAGRWPSVVASSLLLPESELGEARLLYATSGAPAHDYPGHAECAERVPAIMRALQAGGLTEEARPGQVGGRAGRWLDGQMEGQAGPVCDFLPFCIYMMPLRLIAALAITLN